MVRTKIIATLGPSADSQSILRKMILGGLDAVRLNFSHGTDAEHLHRIKLVRSLNRKMKRAIKIMQDLEGYRIRVGRLRNEVLLKKNAMLYLTQEDILGNAKEVPFDYRGPLRVIEQGSLIYIDDGKILLKAIAKEKRRLKTRVLRAGVLKQRKGINILDVHLPFEALTEKDRRDLNVAIKYRLDYVAQSFVRNAGDIRLLKDILHNRHSECKILAKVESKEALDNIDEIINEADGIIVARGDLGICLPIYKVPVFQKELIKKCRLNGKPVVVATQLLDSMTEERLPTRAEVSDVANAILDGTTHLLLSGETAIGKHPHKVVEMMNKIIKNTENYQRRLKESFE
ncbi:MAG: pyruvate kinase [Candidatus Omnitrophica bacterium]|nr:pyruvate kinase [Candidatus Omnitrophota bacterium]